jgi:hypothetical protein
MGEGSGDGACGQTTGQNKSGLMKTAILISIGLFIFWGCTNIQGDIPVKEDKRIALRADTVNVVKLTDTLVVYESTCRGCAFEASTNFDISDSLGIVKLEKIISTDNNPPDMNGGSISKDLVLVPLKTGTTKMKLYKFWKQPVTAADSARFTTYTIQVNN